MDTLILFLILVVQVISLLQRGKIISLLQERNDFSQEDAQVKAMTEQVASATGRLPKTDTKTKGKNQNASSK